MPSSQVLLSFDQDEKLGFPLRWVITVCQILRRARSFYLPSHVFKLIWDFVESYRELRCLMSCSKVGTGLAMHVDWACRGSMRISSCWTILNHLDESIELAQPLRGPSHMSCSSRNYPCASICKTKTGVNMAPLQSSVESLTLWIGVYSTWHCLYLRWWKVVYGWTEGSYCRIL